ncbi:NAD-dependent succinate-semialdehyde dehydrogenase [Sporosarcina sp. 179-K 3D1 HS]|uniref:NAD-dependent succinate-semialdehyde dehydrogenase n=1 Tax=Sporosarcina sp. 179-K 3D1 HS TaxID=3232169 RepID=UPI0039A1728B
METVTKVEKHHLYIDGSWTEPESGEYYNVVNPATGETISQGSYGDDRDAKKAIDAAHAAFKEWAAIPATKRSKYLVRIYDLLLENADRLARTISEEMGKPIREARAEVSAAAEYVLWNAEEAKRTYGDVIPSPIKSKRLQTIRQPVGPVAAITPWNFPLSMVTRKIAPALAAGCTVVFKPDSQTPGSAVEFFKIAEAAGLPKGVLNLVTGNSSKIGSAVMQDQRIRKITFTGSTEIGKLLLRQAAEQVKGVSMELGGHAPFIVFEDADLDKAVEGAVASKFRNSGQTCICTNRIYVQESIKDQFLEKMKAKVEQLVIGNGLRENTEFGPVVNAGSLDKVKNQVQDAVAKGAVIVTGGEECKVEGHENGFFYAPTILSDVDESMLITYEETFGPLAPVYTFKTEEEVIERANDSIYGLASYFYTNDLSRSIRVAEALEYGMVGVNDALITSVQGPFGGVKESGLGREGGPDSLSEFLETKFISTGL